MSRTKRVEFAVMLNHDTCNLVLLLNEHGNSEVVGLLSDMTIHRAVDCETYSI